MEFFFPHNSALSWICFACAAATLGILNDFILKDHNILFKPFILYMMSILLLQAIGFLLMGYDYLDESFYAINHFKHFLTTGVYGLVFFMVLFIVSTIHTGRHIQTNIWTHLGVLLIIAATFIRAMIPWYEALSTQAYLLSSILWALAFIIYIFSFFKYLLQPRADGFPG